MHKQIYLNLAVADLQRSQDFFKGLGFTFNPRFTDDNAACMVIGENIHAMLLKHAFFKGFTDRKLCDTSDSTEVLITLSCESRAEVDALVAKALASGGKSPRAPQDHGFMYAHGFEDLDGHIWELVYMEPSADGAA
ncbi:VOC family protein [Cupriavidus sp. CuC1]|uniref:VOC family protein n=1 Tax=Cupriavidus TaxID=106589 RepID=UPI00296AB82A|nr:VOC family protein [Cupriavidus sp. CV2]MDW3688042.1 VOC family protein [Cupriavidus sp. CV2]